MILVDFGVAAVIVLTVAMLTALWYRSQYKKLHPPPTTQEEIARLQKELGMDNGASTASILSSLEAEAARDDRPWVSDTDDDLAEQRENAMVFKDAQLDAIAEQEEKGE